MPSGQDIMVRAGILLNDEAYVRWTLAEMAQWINEGVRAIVLAKPSAHPTTVVIALQKGTLQHIPAAALQLLWLTRNVMAAEEPRLAGRAIRPTPRAQLDAQEPNWHSAAAVRFRKEVRQFVFDEQNPRDFYVYPGNDGTGLVEAVVSNLPAPLAATGEPADIASYGDDLGLPEPYSVPLLDYVLYRSQLKDDLGGNAGRASGHYQQFATAIGLKIQIEAASSPNSRRTSQ